MPEDLNGGGEARAILRSITASAVAATLEKSTMKSPLAICRELFRGDERAAFYLSKAAKTPTMTSDYPTLTSQTLLPAIAPASAAVRLFALATQVNLDGVTQVRLPGIVNPPPAVFVPEGAPAPALRFSIGGPTVGPARKILLMASVSGELQYASGDTASAIVGRALAEAATKGLDAVVFGNAAADSKQPGGLRYGVTPLAASAGSGMEAAATDIGKAVAAIASAGIDGTDAVVVAPPDLAVKLALLAGPRFTNTVIGSVTLPAGTVMVVAPVAIASGYAGTPEIATSIDVAIHYEDTAPLPIVDGAGTVAVPVRSAFQEDLLVVKVRLRAAWAALPGAVQVLQNVNW